MMTMIEVRRWRSRTSVFMILLQVFNLTLAVLTYELLSFFDVEPF